MAADSPITVCRNVGRRKAVASAIAPVLLYPLHRCSRKAPAFGAQPTRFFYNHPLVRGDLIYDG
jgi:hypothetical protein